MNEEISIQDLKRSILVLWNKKMLLASSTILAALLGLVLTYNTQEVNTYSAVTTVYSTGSAGQGGNNSDISAYGGIVTSTKICQQAADLIGSSFGLEAEDIQKMLWVESSNDTVLTIGVYSENSELAVSVANAVAEAFVRETAGMLESDRIHILDAANKAHLMRDGKKDIFQKRFGFAIAGFMGMSVVVAGRELMSKQVHTVEQCVGENKRELFGVVPNIQTGRKNRKKAR